MTALAYHSDPALKEFMVAEAIAHREADRLIKGNYSNDKRGDNWKGCAVGCSIHSLRQKRGMKKLSHYDHAGLAETVGMPEHLIHLQDRVFEGLSDAERVLWPERFYRAPREGADLSMVWPQFASWLLRDAGLLQVTDRNRKAIQDVIDLYAEWVATGVCPEKARWKASAASAADYATSAAFASAAAYAGYAATSAAVASAAASAAAYAGYAAAYAAAAPSAARQNAWSAIADKLIELMSAA